MVCAFGLLAGCGSPWALAVAPTPRLGIPARQARAAAQQAPQFLWRTAPDRARAAAAGRDGLPSGAVRPTGCGILRARIPLQATDAAAGATGYVEIVLAPSPFGLPVTADGSYMYAIELHVKGLSVGSGVTPMAWVATPELDRVSKVGPLDKEGRAAGRVTWNKFLVVVTAEDAAAGGMWAGPVLLRGVSPSGSMQSFLGHSILGPQPC